jgi:hypothetical protein
MLLKDVYAEESKNAGIRVFGIAFTDQAHFEPIQTLSRKTDGDHYRVSKAEELDVVFDNINEAILSPVSNPKPQAPVKVETPTKRPEKSSLMQTLMQPLYLVLLGLALVLIVVVLTVFFTKRGSGGESDVIEAYLLDMKNATDKKTHKLDKRFITIGRVRGNGVDIVIAKNTVSTKHAQIEYKNRNFYLTDLRSRNGTYLNGAKEKIASEICLKDGDIIAFDQYTFKFVIPEHAKPSRMRADKGSQGRTILRMPE